LQFSLHEASPGTYTYILVCGVFKSSEISDAVNFVSKPAQLTKARNFPELLFFLKQGITIPQHCQYDFSTDLSYIQHLCKHASASNLTHTDRYLPINHQQKIPNSFTAEGRLDQFNSHWLHESDGNSSQRDRQ
jgi:hypothetical protein